MSRAISHLTEASIRLNNSLGIPMNEDWAHDCGCTHVSRANPGVSVWSLCDYHRGFQDGIDALTAALGAEQKGVAR